MRARNDCATRQTATPGEFAAASLGGGAVLPARAETLEFRPTLSKARIVSLSCSYMWAMAVTATTNGQTGRRAASNSLEGQAGSDAW